VTGEVNGEIKGVLFPFEGDGASSLFGTAVFSGGIGTRKGSLMMNFAGGIEGGQPRGTATIIPHAGTGDFKELTGSMVFLEEDSGNTAVRCNFRAGDEPGSN
jgi:hypothetical protein